MTKLRENNSLKYKTRKFGDLAIGDVFRYLETDDKEFLYIKVYDKDTANVICLNDGDTGLCYKEDFVCLVTHMEYQLEKP